MKGSVGEGDGGKGFHEGIVSLTILIVKHHRLLHAVGVLYKSNLYYIYLIKRIRPTKMHQMG